MGYEPQMYQPRPCMVVKEGKSGLFGQPCTNLTMMRIHTAQDHISISLYITWRKWCIISPKIKKVSECSHVLMASTTFLLDFWVSCPHTMQVWTAMFVLLFLLSSILFLWSWSSIKNSPSNDGHSSNILSLAVHVHYACWILVTTCI